MRKLFSTKVSDNALSLALFLLRIAFGGLMLVNHGWGKLTNFSAMSGKFADPFGIGMTTSLALTVFAEFFCAAFIVLGLFTRLAAIPLVIAMAVAFFYAHKGNHKEGEMALLYLTAYVAILVAGPGKASVDRLINK